MPAIPAAMNLGTIPIMIPSIMFRKPVEGPASVAYSIDWARPVAAGLTTVSVNMQDGGTLNFSQICGLIVDNSNCGSDLDFIFPDTDVVVSIPAYAPYTCLQINTQQVQFFVRGLAVVADDKTSFSVLNYAPSPVAVPLTKQQLTAAVSNLNLTGAGSTAIIAPGVNGTIQNLQVNVAFPKPSVSFNDLLQIVDGTGKLLWSCNVAAQDTSAGGVALIGNLNGVALRFVNGLSLVQTGGFAPGGTINALAYYVVP